MVSLGHDLYDQLVQLVLLLGRHGGYIVYSENMSILTSLQFCGTLACVTSLANVFLYMTVVV